MSGGEAPEHPRGELSLSVGGITVTIRPTFAALVRAEEELGALFALVERAASGELRLSEVVGLVWHCLNEAPEWLTRERLGEAIAEAGLATAAPLVRGLIGQILKGR